MVNEHLHTHLPRLAIINIVVCTHIPPHYSITKYFKRFLNVNFTYTEMHKSELYYSDTKDVPILMKLGTLNPQILLSLLCQ